jgi:hypothetical protein
VKPAIDFPLFSGVEGKLLFLFTLQTQGRAIRSSGFERGESLIKRSKHRFSLV